MRNKKPKDSNISAEDEALVKRVDGMMSTKPGSTPPGESEGEPIEVKKSIVKPVTSPAATDSVGSAPEIPASLLKKIKVDPEDEPKPPLKIGSKKDKPEVEEEKPLEEANLDQPAESSVEDDEAKIQPEPLSDKQTDKAVDDIVAHEGDTILALEDAKNERKQNVPESGFKDKLKVFFKSKWTWLGVLLILVVLLAVPVTRYKILGLFIKKSVEVTVIDSQTNTAVSHAAVTIAGGSARTDAEGKAVVKARLGAQTLTVEKQYYQTKKQSYFVGFSSPKPAKVSFIATGRLVPLTVVNKITGKPLAGADIKVLKTTVKTNSKGQASVALPADKPSQTAHVTANGYNPADVTLKVTNQELPENTFALVPAGHIYFLSNASGTLDVVKANLDGSGRKVVLEGTGREQPSTTSLLASRDWRYSILKARRDNHESLYLIDASTDKVTAFDTSNATFSLVGWYNHSFIYSLRRNGQPAAQAGNQQLKSYDAERQQLSQLDQSQTDGTDTSYAYQELGNFYLANNAIVYTTQWYTFGPNNGTFDISTKQSTIRAVQPSGQNKKDYQTFKAAEVGAMGATLYKPGSVYFTVYDIPSAKNVIYEYENQAVKAATDDVFDFSRAYPTYLLSPSGNQTLWTELRDGKNALLIGDAGGNNGKQVASVSGFSPYGWFGDSYTLVSKNGSELYIMPAHTSTKAQPLKITDYYKPAQNYPGYGYGYGGL